MSSGELLIQVKQALTALERGQNIQVASEWLTEFERSYSAWEVAEQCLHETDPFRFFGAKFLYSKLQKQFVSLERSHAEVLTQVLVQHIIRLSKERPVPTAVCRYICLALAACAIQLNQSGVVNQILAWLNPVIQSSPSVLLILLSILPEEATNRQFEVPFHIKESFIEQLDVSSSDVINFLSTIWPQVGVNDRSKVLKCAESWVDIVRTPSTVFFASPLYQYLMQTLRSSEGDLFDSSVDLLVVVIRRYYSKEPASVVDQILPVVLELRSQWPSLLSKIQAEGELSEDLKTTAFSLCRLYTETAESMIDIFGSLQYNYGQQEMIAQLLDCASFKIDHGVSKIPLKFFYELSMMLKAEYTHESDRDLSNAPSPTFQQLITIYSPAFVRLLEISVECITLSNNVLAGTEAMSDEVKDLRLDWKESIVDCCDILTGKTCLGVLCNLMETQIKHAASANSINAAVQWGKIESILYCIQIIAPSIPPEDSSSIPQLISFISTLPKQLPRLQLTAIIFLGQLSQWLDSNRTYILPVLSKLINDLSSPTCSVAAARSVMQILRTCAKTPGLPLVDLNNHIVMLRTNNSISLEAELHVIEGVVIACSYVEPAESEAMFRSLVLSTAQLLNQALIDITTSGSKNLKVVIGHVERLTMLFRFYRGNQAVLCQCFGEVFPLFQGALAHCGSNEALDEKICRCYKHTMRSGSESFLPYLPAMAEHLATQFKVTPFSSLLYVASVAISSFSMIEKGKNVGLLYQLLWSMSETFFSICNSLPGFEAKPDLVEEYYFLVAKVLQYCPAPFVESESHAMSIIRAGLTGLVIPHREAQKGILLFFERFLQLSIFWQEGTPHHTAAHRLIKEIGGQICKDLILLIASNSPVHSIDESNGSITDVLWTLRKRFKPDFKVNRDRLYEVMYKQLSKFCYVIITGLASSNNTTSIANCSKNC